jgi:hypothetical protein
MHKNATKCNKTQSKWCINKHGASKIIDTFETYLGSGKPLAGGGHDVVDALGAGSLLGGGYEVPCPSTIPPAMGEKPNPSSGGGSVLMPRTFLEASSGGCLGGWLVPYGWQ